MEPLERSAIESLKAQHDIDEPVLLKPKIWWMVGVLLLILAGVVTSVSFTMNQPSNFQTDNQSP